MNATDWQPIETAPRDGTEVLLYFPPSDDTSHYVSDNGYATGFWGQDGSNAWYHWEGDGNPLGTPSHWIRLPLPPEDKP